MIRLVLVFAGAVGLILLVAFAASRVLRSRTRGISVRLQVFVALALIVGAFAAGLGLLVLDRIQARATLLASEAAHDEAAAIASFIGGQIDSSTESLESIAANLVLERQRGGPSQLRMSLLDPHGVEVFSDGPREGEPGTVAALVQVTTRNGIAGQVKVVKPTIIMRRLLADFAPTVLIISVILGAAAAAAAGIIGREIARPIESLTAFAERVSEGDRKANPPVARGREVKRLSASIDKMRRELEGRPYVESFAADLSHELKNPVAAIRAAAEVLDEGALSEPAEAVRFVRRIREATSRIEALLAELLNLARIEARGLQTEEPVDLGSLARRSIETHAGIGPVRLEVDPNAKTIGDPKWIARAIDNLIVNALTHGDGRLTVSVAVSQSGNNVECVVTNSGRIAPHIRQRLFRRFVTNRGEKGGTGLGLPIVQAVAEAHGGTVKVAELPEGIVEFRLVLPKR